MATLLLYFKAVLFAFLFPTCGGGSLVCVFRTFDVKYFYISLQ